MERMMKKKFIEDHHKLQVFKKEHDWIMNICTYHPYNQHLHDNIKNGWYFMEGDNKNLLNMNKQWIQACITMIKHNN
jgi:hypothetical protein